MSNLPPPGPTPPPPPPPPEGYVPPPGHSQILPSERATVGQRLGALLLDGLIVAVPIGLILIALVLTLPRKSPELCEFDGELAVCEPLTAFSTAVLVSAMVASFVVVVGWYYGHNEGRKGQTIGKRIVGIEVVGKYTREPIGFGRGIGRYFARILSNLCFGLGYLWAIWDKESEAWHDKMVNSAVIDRRMMVGQR